MSDTELLNELFNDMALACFLDEVRDRNMMDFLEAMEETVLSGALRNNEDGEGNITND